MTAYSDVFLVLTSVVVLGAFAVLRLRKARATPTPTPAPTPTRAPTSEPRAESAEEAR